MMSLLLNPTKSNFLNVVTSSLTQNKSSSNNVASSASATAAKVERHSWTGTVEKTEFLSSSSHSAPPSSSKEAGQSSPASFAGSASSLSSFGSLGSSNSGNSSDTTTDDSFRGLEKYINRSSGKAQKNPVWDAVLIEQDQQERFGYYDDEKIARLYKRIQDEHNGQQTVLDRAQKDRKAVDSYLLTPRTMKLMNEGTTTTTSTVSTTTTKIKANMKNAPMLVTVDAENIAPACNNQYECATTATTTTSKIVGLNKTNGG